MTRRMVIWGCGGHGREVALLCREIGVDLVGFLDERPHMRGELIDGVPVLGALREASSVDNDVEFLPGGVGSPSLKRRFAEEIAAQGRRIADPIVHPFASIGEAVLGPGVVVAAFAVMTVNVRVGAHVTINRSANLSHDVVVGSYSTIAPGAIISGNVTIGEGVTVGVNSSVREGHTIGHGAVVGGNTFVATDVLPGITVGGVPARVLEVTQRPSWTDTSSD